MSTEKNLRERSGSICELCGDTDRLEVYSVGPNPDDRTEKHILICYTCSDQIQNLDQVNVNHWRCLNDSMWSPIPAVQVMAWRMLTYLSAEGWPQELLDSLYLDEGTLAWAQTTTETEEDLSHKDSNGVLLIAGDTVVLIKDLPVKGASFTAKRGTSVRGISLVPDNTEHIEGRVNGQKIVILTKFVKKSK